MISSNIHYVNYTTQNSNAQARVQNKIDYDSNNSHVIKLKNINTQVVNAVRINKSLLSVRVGQYAAALRVNFTTQHTYYSPIL